MSKRKLEEIQCDENGLAITAENTNMSMRSLKWNDVKTIIAYKCDVYAFDLICLAFDTSDGTIKINEEMRGWSQLVERLPSLIPGAPPLSEWWERVAKPPFATCAMTLFKRT
jgi:hypothetical protein